MAEVINSTPSAFFCKDNPSKTFQKQEERKAEEVNNIIEYLKENSPISIWNLAKELNISHSKVYYILRDLEFAGVIFSKMHKNKSNRMERLIFIGGRK